MLPQELTLTSRCHAPCILQQETLTHTFTFQEPAPRILACDARVLSCGSAPQGEAVRVEGEAELRLFLCTGGVLSVQSLRLPYAVCIPAQAGDCACAAAQVSPVRLRRESPCIYRAECVLEITLRPRPQASFSLVQHLPGDDVQTLTRDIAYLREEIIRSGRLSVQEDVLLDPTLPEVGEILTLGGELSISDCRANAGEVEMTGELSAHLLYSSKDSGLPMTAHFTVPVHLSLREGDFSQGAAPHVLCGAVDLTSQIYADVQGEDRLLHISAECEVTLFEAQTETERVLVDAFCENRELIVETQDLLLPQAPIRRTCTVPLRLTLPQETAGSPESLYTLAHLQPDSVTSGSGQIRVEASLAAQVITREEGGSYRTCSLSAPVSFTLPGTEMDPDVTVTFLQLQGQYSGGQWILQGKAVLQLTEYPTLAARLAAQVTQGDALEPEPWDIKLLIAAQGDSLWSLAKKSRVKPQDLCSCNPQLSGREVEPGDRILVVR